MQKSISFGRKGHSMIVDRAGRVIAHPKKEWQKSSKDASGISVVQAMMRGETGVTVFYSPPLKGGHDRRIHLGAEGRLGRDGASADG
ncbi:MAG: hypothetical protein QF701_05090 [Nitrospinota bacterium]|nr:hypothetical protein [Nitrospinota bacterium]MDP6364799.1 hypothetical protein [Nitrospinota bacterium]MDP7167118.1 hypothetical protein [Nitrospinota bacterium]MDP7369327.1 hypothetical protein [Nitrospinota bacterium]MDP7504597.1 hypothetical protein [Nitrospinota bacterium]